jgi:hypothetical protein
MKKISILTAFLIILPFLLISCKDEVVVPPPPPSNNDTNDVYDWEIYPLPGYLYNCYPADTNAVLINCLRKPYLFRDSTMNLIELNDPQFFLVNLYAVDTNTFYFFGGYQNSSSKPEFKIWNNGVITSYTLPDNYARYAGDYEVINPGDLWIGVIFGNSVHHFVNGQITSYVLPDSLESTYIYKAKDNSIFVYGFTFDRLNLLYMYKLLNNTFFLTRKDTLGPTNGYNHYIYKCGEDLVMTAGEGWNKMLRFDKNEWIYFSNGPSSISNLGGTTYQNLICFNWELKIYIMNNNFLWRAEKNFYLPYAEYRSVAKPIYLRFNSVYMTLLFQFEQNYLVIGKLKK